jgi:hypothetical protein
LIPRDPISDDFVELVLLEVGILFILSPSFYQSSSKLAQRYCVWPLIGSFVIGVPDFFWSISSSSFGCLWRVMDFILLEIESFEVTVCL